jgi:hypothetical protein
MFEIPHLEILLVSVADMDRVSKIKVAKNSAWMSIYKTLTLTRNLASESFGSFCLGVVNLFLSVL